GQTASPPESVDDAVDPPLQEASISTKRVWRDIVSSGSMWGLCGQQFCRGAGYMFYASWFATYLQESHGVSIGRSGVLNSLPLLASVVGCVVGGWVSDKVLQVTGSLAWARRGLSVLSMLSCAALILIAFFIGNADLAVVIISCGAFCAAFAGPCAYTATIDMGGAHVAQVFSTMNMAGNVGAVAFPFIVPELIEASGNWDQVLFLFCGLYVAAAVCWLAVRPQQVVVGAKRVEEE
ncbi:MAG: MFS transporter, partial [Planctomycetaceae bacterium]